LRYVVDTKQKLHFRIMIRFGLEITEDGERLRLNRWASPEVLTPLHSAYSIVIPAKLERLQYIHDLKGS
jgi:hypothetical protein